MINGIANKSAVLDQIVILVAEYLPFVFIAILLYLWFINKQDSRNKALYAVYSSIIGLAMNLAITLVYFHPRPFMNKVGTMLINHLPETSFPSDHTTFMLSIALLLLFVKETRAIGIALTILGIVGGLARVVCGIHYPLDIIGSFIVAIGSSLFVIAFQSRLVNLNQRIHHLYSQVAK